jgi:polyphenol oxidase
LIAQQRKHACFLQFEQYLQFPAITHGVFTRQGGFSTSPYAGLNASYSTGDSFDNVVRNRLSVLKALDIVDYPCATLWQVHGAEVAVLDTQREQWDDWRSDWAHRSYRLGEEELVWTTKARRKADAIITRQAGVALALAFADCSPLLFYDPQQGVIGMAHGGWRGTARGVALATVEAMTAHYDCQPRNILAAVAPSIGPCCYEVTQQVQRLFMGQAEFDEMPTLARYGESVRASAVFSTRRLADRESLRLDIRATNREQLLMAGLLPEHIEMADICTGCRGDLFYSHRVEQGRTGRFPVVMALKQTG